MIRLVAFAGISCLLFLVAVGSAQAQNETVCIQCHSGQSEKLATPVAEWRQSVHAENGISCHDCHGGDPTDFSMAMSPERGFRGAPDYAAVPEFCGHCHVGVLQDYQESAHGQAVEAGGAQCVVCHHAHAVKKAEIDLINQEDCSRCHDYGRAGEIKAAIVDTEKQISSVEEQIGKLHSLGIATDQMEGTLFDLRNRYRRLFHSVEVQKVRSETKAFQDELQEIKKKIADIHSTLKQRKIWGAVAVGLFFFGGLISFLIRKSYHQEE